MYTRIRIYTYEKATKVNNIYQNSLSNQSPLEDSTSSFPSFFSDSFYRYIRKYLEINPHKPYSKDPHFAETDDYTPSISGILPAVSAALGKTLPSTMHPYPAEEQKRIGIPSCKSIVVVLIDGLGYWNLSAAKSYAPYLSSLMNSQSWALSTYPSTTSVALTAFGTGECPGLTGVLGYAQLNPISGKLAQMIQFRDSIPPLDLQTIPTYFERLNHAGLITSTIGLPSYKNSGLTLAALRGAHYYEAPHLESAVQLVPQVAQSSHLTYFYIPDIDKAGHPYGWGSAQWIKALEKVDYYLRLLRNNLKSDTILIITADHGMVQMKPNEQKDISKQKDIVESIKLIGGEPRSTMLYITAEYSSLQESLKQFIGDSALIKTKEQVIDSYLLGDINPKNLAAMGDIFLTCTGNATIVDSRTQSENARKLLGVHGSWTLLESCIPLLLDPYR